MENLAVLFVDDETPILNSLRRLLRNEPYTMLTAESGAEGLRILAEHEIHLVVSDQRMPEMDGAEFLHKVKERWPDTVRVVLSGFAEAGAIVESINRGEVYRFLGKPWNDDELKRILRQCLEHYVIKQENRRLTAESERQVAELQRLNRLLEDSVEARTQMLQLSQEVVESLPSMVLGISQEEELVLTNASARSGLSELSTALPGTDIEHLLPPEAIAAIRNCLASGRGEVFIFPRTEGDLRARSALLGNPGAPRGCMLILEKA